ncbi:transglutaminase domain-containing protein [Angelakisella massiliensis]|uniref:transglutaminase domain-containing protein n=1 Tax=Angelakisella massiliensis TaxID=1871018 RepID=UPI0024B08F90|nr:transglutaminase domain-containing protein [Angelakisella massiliensis]
MEYYYYSHLAKAEQAIYRAMLDGISSLSLSFAVPKAELTALNSILFRLRLDHPEIFYVTGFSCRIHPDASCVTMLPDYLFDRSKVREHQKALSTRVRRLADGAKNMSEVEKEQYIHDFICRNIRYDKLKKAYSHEIIGPLGQGVGVCEGIAKTVKILCDALGLWCIIAISEAAPDKGIKYRHAWNIIRLKGQYYHLDATFDGTLTGEDLLRYDYFNLDDRWIFRDHQPVLFPVPACTDSAQSYYRSRKLSFTKEEEVCKRAAQAIRKGLPLAVHWRGGFLTREVLVRLMEQLEQAARQKGRHVQLSLNWPQAVLCLRFPQTVPQQTLITEEANEGEQDGEGSSCEHQVTGC